MRLDKFIWAIRLFKTRSLASVACGNEKVKVNSDVAKASRTVKSKDIISIRVAPIWRSFEVLDIPKSRIGAKLLVDYVVETTPQEDLGLLENQQLINRQNKMLGIKGRPTKKDRRDIDKFSL
ncbi:MAG: RNA-binding S4 domain-containing protein [Salibacteraceae bacterium]